MAHRHAEVDASALNRGYASTEAVSYADRNTDSSLGLLLPWRLRSGFAHGRPWASLTFSESEVRPTEDPNDIAVRFSTDLLRAFFLVLAAMYLMEDLLRLHGQRSQPSY